MTISERFSLAFTNSVVVIVSRPLKYHMRC